MGMTYKELSDIGRLRKVQQCGPYTMFIKLLDLWKNKYEPNEVGVVVYTTYIILRLQFLYHHCLYFCYIKIVTITFKVNISLLTNKSLTITVRLLVNVCVFRLLKKLNIFFECIPLIVTR